MHSLKLIPRSTVCLLRQSIRETNRYTSQLRWLSSYPNETFSLPVGNNGAVSLRVTRPALSESNASASTGEKVILYLPPGPLKGLRQDPAKSTHQHNAWPILNDPGSQLSTSDFSVESALARMTSATVVTVNYRLGPSESHPSTNETEPSQNEAPQIHQYPTPIHDTLLGLDWILENLIPTKLGIFGSHIGGSLALMLALTEANSVHAVGVLDPICDWPGLDEYCITEEDTEKASKKKKHRKIAPPDLVPLLQARETYFSTFSRCFDPFASPVLLLRSAGRDVPRMFPRYLTRKEYPVPVLDADIPSENEVSDRDRDLGDDMPSPVRRRKALSRWPPYGLDYGSSGPSWLGQDYGVKRLEIELPWVRVFSSVGSADGKSHDKNPARSTVLDQQAEEMVSVMQRACFWGREKGFGERRVTLSRVDENLGREVRRYFEDVFGRGSRDD